MSQTGGWEHRLLGIRPIQRHFVQWQIQDFSLTNWLRHDSSEGDTWRDVQVDHLMRSRIDPIRWSLAGAMNGLLRMTLLKWFSIWIKIYGFFNLGRFSRTTYYVGSTPHALPPKKVNRPVQLMNHHQVIRISHFLIDLSNRENAHDRMT